MSRLIFEFLIIRTFMLMFYDESYDRFETDTSHLEQDFDYVTNKVI